MGGSSSSKSESNPKTTNLNYQVERAPSSPVLAGVEVGSGKQSVATLNLTTTDQGTVDAATKITLDALDRYERQSTALLNSAAEWAGNQSKENRDFASAVIERSQADGGASSDLFKMSLLAGAVVVGLAMMGGKG